jgi:hypothetical protein
VSNFIGQWLHLRNVDASTPTNALFPDFDEGLRRAFRRETELFVGSIMREDRPVPEMLTADYTFVNERLARHYDIPNVYGPRFRRVHIVDTHRRGLLGHGSILTITSRPNRTSPVLRGKWILENLLGVVPPPPPPNVPAFPEQQSVGKVRSVRDRLTQHRSNPTCASCHTLIDPPGFALEHFDAVGRWRDVDETLNLIDASGSLFDGTKIDGDGIDQLREALINPPDRFVTTMTERAMAYALGRGLEYYDAPAIRRVVRESAANGYRFSSIVVGIVTSVPFQMRRTELE